MGAPNRYNAGTPVAGVTLVDAASGDPVGSAGNPLITASGTGGSGVAQGSNTAGQSGGLVQGAVTTATPAYTNLTTNPISLTTAGELRVRLSDNGTAPSIGSPNSDAQSGVNAGINTRSFGLLLNNTGTNMWSRMTDLIAANNNGTGIQSIASVPNSASTAAIVPAALAAVGGSQIAKASAGNLYGFNVTTGAASGYIMIFDSTTVPADGAVTPKKVYAVAANTTTDRSFNLPLRFVNGITIVFSTTGPYTKTISATAFIESETV